MRALGAVSILLLVVATGCSYSFGSDVCRTGTIASPVGVTSFGGDVEVPLAPRGARVRAFGGAVHIGPSSGRIVATSYGGAIDVASLGAGASIRSYGGEVDVQLAENASAQPRLVRIAAYGGDVTLRIPEGFGGTIDVRVRCRPHRADEYTIDSDFDLETAGTDVRSATTLFRERYERRFAGSVGKGSDRITIRVEEANVRLLKS